MTTAVLESLIEECISPNGVHLIDLLVKNEGKGNTIEMYIDSENGVTAEVCSEVSRAVKDVFQSSGMDVNRLTVSSPGISRPLKFTWQYKKHVGRDLLLKVRSGAEEKDVAGVLTSVGENGLTIQISKNAGPRSIGFDAIVEAKLRTPW